MSAPSGRRRSHLAAFAWRARRKGGRIGRQAGVLPPRPAILMYHRIARDQVDPWGLAVPAHHFEEHLRWLAKHTLVLPLAEFGRRHRCGDLPDRAVAITFDDGYACNATVAAPLLAAHGLPATVFVTTGPVASGREFWWDDLQRIVSCAPRGHLELIANGPHLRVDLGDREMGATPWFSDRPAVTTRQKGFMALWRALRALDPPVQAAALEELRAEAGAPVEPRESHRPMTLDELKSLAGSDLVDIGCHTLTHPALTERAALDQRTEVEGGLRRCEAMIGRTPTSFAYPFGDHDAAAVAVVGAAGFDVACTTERAPVTPGCDPLALPRLAAGDWSAGELARAVRGL